MHGSRVLIQLKVLPRWVPCSCNASDTRQALEGAAVIFYKQGLWSPTGQLCIPEQNVSSHKAYYSIKTGAHLMCHLHAHRIEMCPKKGNILNSICTFWCNKQSLLTTIWTQDLNRCKVASYTWNEEKDLKFAPCCTFNASYEFKIRGLSP